MWNYKSNWNFVSISSQAPRGFHRMDVFWPLMHLLQRKRNPISCRIWATSSTASRYDDEVHQVWNIYCSSNVFLSIRIWSIWKDLKHEHLHVSLLMYILQYYTYKNFIFYDIVFSAYWIVEKDRFTSFRDWSNYRFEIKAADPLVYD